MSKLIGNPGRERNTEAVDDRYDIAWNTYRFVRHVRIIHTYEVIQALRREQPRELSQLRKWWLLCSFVREALGGEAKGGVAGDRADRRCDV